MMKNVCRIICVALASVFLAFSAGAQAIYTPYPVPSDSIATVDQAPDGYKVVYVSHFGRHGSLYLLSKYLDAAYDKLDKYDSLKRRAVLYMYRIHNGNVGKLAPLGAMEQEGIGRRLAQRLPGLFGPDAPIRAKSSMADRCKKSMQNFLLGLGQGNKLSLSESSTLPIYMRYSRGIKKHQFKFNNDLNHRIWHYGADAVCIGLDKDLISRLFTPQEWDALQADGDFYYRNKLFPYSREEAKIALPLLDEIIFAADAFLKGKRKYVAEFRFGHDSALVPLAALMGLKGFCLWRDEAAAVGSLVPMAANLQLIFYKNEIGNVIVKILHNEQVTSIPDLHPETYKNSDPYYKWSELKAYFLGAPQLVQNLTVSSWKGWPQLVQKRGTCGA